MKNIVSLSAASSVLGLLLANIPINAALASEVEYYYTTSESIAFDVSETVHVGWTKVTNADDIKVPYSDTETVVRVIAVKDGVASEEKRSVINFNGNSNETTYYYALNSTEEFNINNIDPNIWKEVDKPDKIEVPYSTEQTVVRVVAVKNGHVSDYTNSIITFNNVTADSAPNSNSNQSVQNSSNNPVVQSSGGGGGSTSNDEYANTPLTTALKSINSQMDTQTNTNAIQVDVGAMAYGWNNVNGQWYYKDSNIDNIVINQWISDNSKWYHLGNNGIMDIGWYQDIDNNWYHLNNSGAMDTGWYQDIDNKWYHLSNNGIMDIGWYQDTDNNWYHLNNSGAMDIGWYQDTDNNWYHLNNSGAMDTGWYQDVDGNWYYLNSNGTMAYNTIIDGYYLNEHGVLS